MKTDVFDVITMGRIGTDIYPLQQGVGLEVPPNAGTWCRLQERERGIGTDHGQ